MATFYIQLENRLLQISGELTAENISKALGYVPVDSSTMSNYATKDEVSDLVDMSMVEELSQRVDNITFDSLKDNPFLQDGSGELNIVDEAGNIIAKVNAEGIHSVDFIAGEHRLSNKTDKAYVDGALKNAESDLTGYVNNIDFYNIKNNPIIDGEENSLTLVDENSNIGLKVTEDGLYVKDVIAAGHILSQKADKSDIPSLDGYATEGWVVNQKYLTEHQDISHLATKDEIPSIDHLATKDEVSNIDFYNINNNPIVNNGDGKLLFVDENGYIGLQLEEDGLYVKDVFADGHTLSQKADRAELSNYATKDEVSDLVDMSVVTELQGKVNRLIDTDGDKSVRDIAVDVLTETLVSETATEAYDTLAEMSAWIKSHPEDASAMNNAIQKNATDITNLDAAYKAADAEVLKDAQEYTNNINFYAIKDNPIVDNNDGNLTFVDASGNMGLQFSNNAILVNDVITPEHTLSNKADKAELPTKTSELTNDSGFITINDIPTKVSAFENDKGYVTASEIPSLDDYVKSENLPNFDDFVKTEDIPSLEGLATEEYVNSKDAAVQQWVNDKGYTTQEDIANIKFYSIKDNPIINNGDGRLVFADENGNIGLQIEADNTLYVKDIIAGDHTLSNKADTSYVNAAVAGIVDGAPETLNTLNELAAALNDNADIVDVLNQSIGSKQDVITDLETIRQNAAKGATALQSYTEQYKGTVTEVKINGGNAAQPDTNGVVDLTLSSVAQSGSYNDLLNKPTIPSLDGYATENWVNTNYYNQSTVDTKIAEAVTGGTVSLDGFATEQWVNEQGFITLDEIPAEQFKGTVTGVTINGGDEVEPNGNGIVDITIQTGEQNVQSDWNVDDVDSDAYIHNKPTLSTVAITGSYSDLSNKPTIPSESTVFGWGFTKNTGTVTGVKFNNSDTAIQPDASGVVDLGTVITEYQPLKTINGESIIGGGDINIPITDTSNFPQYDFQQAITVQGINNGYGATYAIPGSDIADGGEYVDTFALKSEIPDTSGFALKSEIPDTSGLATQANLTSAVTQMTTNLAKKQDKLVSGTNIITINSNSILGSGNLDLVTTEQLRSFQPALVSGTNIKTINNESIVGSGNIIIPMNLKYIHTSNASTGTINISLQPNACVYLANKVGSGTSRTTLNITAPSSNNALISSTNNGDLIESSIIFSIPTGATPTIVFDLDIDNNSSSDMSIKWVNDTPPTFTAGKTYEINFIYPATSGVGLGLAAYAVF